MQLGLQPMWLCMQPCHKSPALPRKARAAKLHVAPVLQLRTGHDLSEYLWQRDAERGARSKGKLAVPLAVLKLEASTPSAAPKSSGSGRSRGGGGGGGGQKHAPGRGTLGGTGGYNISAPQRSAAHTVLLVSGCCLARWGMCGKCLSACAPSSACGLYCCAVLQTGVGCTHCASGQAIRHTLRANPTQLPMPFRLDPSALMAACRSA